MLTNQKECGILLTEREVESMKNFKRTQVEALALEIFEDGKENIGEAVTWEEALEMAKMELGAKEITRYEKSDTPRKARERKVDPDKKYLLDLLIKGFTSEHPRMIQVKNEAEFSFNYNENAYTVKLIKHRKEKK